MDSGLRTTPLVTWGLRAVRQRVRGLLIDFALWNSGVWDPTNADDVAAASQWVDHFLEGGEPR